MVGDGNLEVGCQYHPFVRANGTGGPQYQPLVRGESEQCKSLTVGRGRQRESDVTGAADKIECDASCFPEITLALGAQG